MQPKLHPNQVTNINPPAELSRLRTWAHDKIKAGSEPPWAWYQYMKLMETIDAILEGMAVTSTESSRESDRRRGKTRRLTETRYHQDASRPHPVGSKVLLPM